jgi:hypothetical protein
MESEHYVKFRARIEKRRSGSNSKAMAEMSHDDDDPATLREMCGVVFVAVARYSFVLSE